MTAQQTLAKSNLVHTESADTLVSSIESKLDAWAARERALEDSVCRLPQETLRDFRRSGVLAAPVPRALGGSGADLEQTTRAVRMVAKVAPATALSLAMPLGNAANARVADEDVAPALRLALARGRAFIANEAVAGRILAVANSEPGAGGELANTRTRAVRSASGELRLSGEKSFATLGPDADYFLCSARMEDGSLDAFFVARSAEGVTVKDDWQTLGLRATASVGLTLADAPVRSVFLYPGAIQGVNARHWSTLLLASVLVGIGEGALAAASACAPKSSSFARSTLAECALALDAAAAFVEAVALAEQIPCSARALQRSRRAKTFAARAAWDTATRAMTIAGGRAYHPGHAVARFLLDAAAGPLLRPPLASAMDAIAGEVLES